MSLTALIGLVTLTLNRFTGYSYGFRFCQFWASYSFSVLELGRGTDRHRHHFIMTPPLRGHNTFTVPYLFALYYVSKTHRNCFFYGSGVFQEWRSEVDTICQIKHSMQTTACLISLYASPITQCSNSRMSPSHLRGWYRRCSVIHAGCWK